MIVFVSTCVHKVAASNLISSASAILYVELCARWVLPLCLRLNIISSERSVKLYLINTLSCECVCVSNCNYENNDETQVFASYSWHYFNFSMNTNQNTRTKLDTTFQVVIQMYVSFFRLNWQTKQISGKSIWQNANHSQTESKNIKKLVFLLIEIESVFDCQ